jgi:serine/threonine protein kinase/WD40 repeat protein/tetratricopeptide (TPR) repeat protein
MRTTPDSLDARLRALQERWESLGQPAQAERVAAFLHEHSPNDAEVAAQFREWVYASVPSGGRGLVAPAAEGELRPGDEIDGYRILNRVGAGGMGVVYRAQDPRLPRVVALKMIRGGLSGSDLHRFRTEMEALALLKHLHIVQIFTSGTAGDRLYFVMEFLERGSLLDAVRGRPQAPRESARLVLLLARAIQAAHELQILHRDLKPANVLLAPPADVPALNTAWGWPKVADFGLAKLVGDGAGLTAGGPMGTPAYMAPEQVRGRPDEIGPAVDVYGLGAILYELLAGQPPFLGSTVQEVWDRVLNQEPVPPRRHLPEIPERLEHICLRCLAKKRDARYPTAEALAAELGDFLADRPETVVSENRSVVLLCSRLVEATGWKSRLGNLKFGELVRQHDELFRQALQSVPGATVLRDEGDGFLAAFPSITGAVTAALQFQHAVQTHRWEAGTVQVRQAIHIGDVAEMESPGGQSKVIGLAADLVESIARLALPGQILLTTLVSYEARNNVPGHPETSDGPAPPLQWKDHGPYVFAGHPEPVPISEVGAAGSAPLREPPDTDFAHRNLAETEKVTHGEQGGWRPGCGLVVPQRENWVLERRLGEGGFGEVWLGGHRKTGQHRVFKFCFQADRLAGLRLESALFRLMKQTLGERADIAQIIDWQFDTAPYFLESEYTPGGSLIDWVQAQGGLDRVPLATRLELVAQTAEALAAAHRGGVLHRDIKPQNILVRMDAAGAPHAVLADFSIGRLTDPALFRMHGITTAGMTRALGGSSDSGTRMYMAPEVVAGEVPTTQSDIYALGVILYQVATGSWQRRPEQGWERDVPDEILREDIAGCVDMDRDRRLRCATDLSERLRRLEERRAERRAELERERRTLEQRARRRRRQAALVVLVVLAFLGSTLYWSVRETGLHHEAEAARERAEGLLGDLQTANGRLQEEKQRTEQLSRANNKIAARFMVEKGMGLATGDNPDLSRALVWFAEAFRADPEDRAAAHRLRLALTRAQCPRLAQVWPHDEKVAHALFHPSGTQVITAAGKLVQCFPLDSDRPLWRLPLPGPVAQLALSADGRRLLTRTSRDTVQVWDVSQATPAAGPFQLDGVTHASIDRQGKRLVALTKRGTAEVWDSQKGGKVTTLAPQEPPPGNKEKSPPEDRAARERPDGFRRAEISPDGKKVVTEGPDGVRLWDASSGKPLVTLLERADLVSSVAISIDMKCPHKVRVLAATDRVFLSEGYPVLMFEIVGDAVANSDLFSPPAPTLAATFSPDGQWVATFNNDRIARLWPADSGERQLRSRKARESIKSGFRNNYSRNDRAGSPAAGLAAADFPPERDGRVLDVPAGAQPHLPPQDAVVRGEPGARGGDLGPGTREDVVPPATSVPYREGNFQAAFSPDGRYFATAGSDATAGIWRVDGGPAASPLHHGGLVTQVRFSSDGRWVLTAGEDGRTRLWDLRGDYEIPQSPQDVWSVRNALLSADGSRVLYVGQDERFRVCDARSGQAFFPPTGTGRKVSRAWISPDGRRLAILDAAGKLQFRDGDSGRLLAAVGEKESIPDRVVSQSRVLFLPDGRSAITAQTGVGLRKWSIDSGRQTAAFAQRGVFEGVFEGYVALTRDGSRLVALLRGEEAPEVRTWDVATVQPAGPPLRLPAVDLGLQDSEWPAEVSPNGRWLLTVHEDGIRIWDLSSDREAAAPLLLAAAVRDARFSPDGRFVIGSGKDGRVACWDVETGDLLAPPLSHYAEVRQAVVSADGGALMTLTARNTLRHWPLSLADDCGPEAWIGLAGVQSGSRLDREHGRLTTLEAPALRRLWDELRGAPGAVLVPPPRPDPDWHWRAALACEEADRWTAASWHLSRLLPLRPQDRELQRNFVRRYETLTRDHEGLVESGQLSDWWRNVLAGYQSLLDAAPADWTARETVGRACQRLASLELQLGRVATAREYAERSVRMAKELEGDRSIPEESRLGCAFPHLWLGIVRFKTGLADRAQEAFQDALDVPGKHLQAGPAAPAARDRLADVQYAWGLWQLARGDAGSALEQARRCVEQRQEARKARPSEDARERLAGAYALLGDAHLELGDLPRAQEAYEKVQQFQPSRLALPRLDPDLRRSVANLWGRLGRLKLRGGDYAAAADHFRKSVSLLALLEADRVTQYYRWDGPDVSLTEQRRSLAACKLAPRGIEDLPFARSQPREVATELLILRAVTLARKGDYAGAEEAAEELRKLAPDDPQNLFHLARCHAQLVRAVAQGQPETNLADDVRARRKASARKGVEALGRAVEKGFTDVVAVLQEGDLDVLRGEPGYRALVERLDTCPE